MISLAYCTASVVPSDGAQSRQIARMVRAFSTCTILSVYLPETHQSPDPLGLRTVTRSGKSSYPRWLRTLFVIVAVLKAQPRSKTFYTRDVAIAASLSLLGFRVIYEAHNPFRTRLGHLLYQSVKKRMLTVAISDGLKEHFVRRYHVPMEAIIVAHDGASDEHCNFRIPKSEARKYLGLEQGEFIAVYAGSLASHKGTDLIAQSAPLLPDVKFYVLGGDSSAIEKFRIRIGRLAPNISLKGGRPETEIPYWYQAADVLLLPNTRENDAYLYTSPLKGFEYLASGVPTVASNIGALSEIVDDKTATLFDPSSAAGLVEAIRKVQNDPLGAKQKATFAALKICGNFTWNKRAEGIVASIERANLWQK